MNCLSWHNPKHWDLKILFLHHTSSKKRTILTSVLHKAACFLTGSHHTGNVIGLYCHLMMWRMRQCMKSLWQQNFWGHISYTRGLLCSSRSGRACLSGWGEILKSSIATMLIVMLELIELQGIIVAFFCGFTERTMVVLLMSWYKIIQIWPAVNFSTMDSRTQVVFWL